MALDNFVDLRQQDYAQHIVEHNASEIRCIFTTDILSADDKLKERLAPFFAKTHKRKAAFKPSSDSTQGDIN